MQTNMTIAMSSSTYPGVAGHAGLGMSFSGVGVGGNVNISLGDYPSSARHVSPDSLSPGSPSFSHQFNADPYSRGLTSSQGQEGSIIGYGAHQTAYHPSQSASSSPDNKDDEILRLRRRVQELEHELNQSKTTMANLRTTVASSGLPTPPQSAAFQTSLRTRIEARKRIYCSLNRAGNALCAWHDSRRERRAYPPRNAPPGYLNCGCTYDEALFEESLARHEIGSYLPGETVRMDPALRNPLLRLLQRRYGYKDGDFEHDPITETWAEGESPSAWEKKARNGGVVKRRTDADKH